MSFIKQFFGKNEPSKEDLEEFLNRKIEEGIHLDYKHFKAVNNPFKLAIHLSSFANSDGGLIILGIVEDEIKENGKIIKIFPKEVTWGDLSYSKETLEQQLLHRINPPIPDLTLVPIRNESKKVIFLIDIPKSNLAPHMAPDHRYHKRRNFITELMEHYEVQRLFRMNWIMKENLVEVIYEPLSQALEESIKHLNDDNFYLSSGDIEDVLSNTYYARQMPTELLEQVNRHIQRMENLHKKLSYTRIALKKILIKNIFKIIEITQPKNYERIGPSFIFIAEDEENNAEINIYELYKLLLNDQKIKEHIEKKYSHKYSEINIHYQEPHHVSLKIFNGVFWKQCLKEVALDSEISQMKKDRTSLIIETEGIINMIIKY